MTKIKAILIDDEQSARNVLNNLLERTSSIEVVAICCDLEEGVEKIKELKPQVVFLDVQMPNYAGYEIVKFFKKINFEIIFVTAYDQYAIKAFELNAIDYLVKPIDRQKLTDAISKLEEKLGKQNKLVDYQNLLATIKDKNYKKIVLPEIGNRRIVDLDNIIAVEADGAYSKIHLKDTKVITTSKNLKYFENVLPKDSSFFRTHRAWIINISYIKFLNKTDLSITLADGILKARISRARVDDFEEVFLQ
ncbi:LytTR family two component transcriptional regulator [Lutibacter sp. Hel_I_33_5]|uniref:LytR/AlgR family response regulator transcription factor n=1 Tax=Lutibacter sp. Hel_I_33_5 TaxID=1566289 RepID=UPI00119DFB59|nr:response regulator [Lutibacter sp. Hel_I_33_5]TVZ55003.1 LytTR family two component transcriptional regulator [Lutibacter sp. Hel_I_33_5]